MGWLARPNPIGAIKLAYIQVVQLMVEKLNGIPFQFGSELKPGSHWSVLITEFLPIAILLILAIWAWLKNKHTLKSESILLWSSLILAMIFGGIFVFIARRSIDLFVGFGLIFAALSWSLFGSKIRHSNILLTVFFAVLAANTLYFANIYKKQAI